MLQVAIDIGGTLCKILIRNSSTKEEQFYSMRIDAFRCLKDRLDGLILQNESVQIGITGGGAIKYKSEIQHHFPQARTFDEMECLSQGFLQTSTLPQGTSHILVHIGTGVSFIKINLPSGEARRIGGTNLGGSVLAGFCHLRGWSITESLLLAMKGDRSRVDTLVSDIYGSGYDEAALRGDLVAGSLGKLTSDSLQADAIAGILFMIASNLCHLLLLYSQQHESDSLVLSGSLSASEAFQAAFKEAMQFYDPSAQLKFQFITHPEALGCKGILNLL